MTSALPRITVAMSVYNNEPFVQDAIASILAQEFRDFEFLIVNDGSRDGSAAIINAMAAADSRIRPIHQENRGLIASLNRMVEEARAPLIARMDGDDLAMPARFGTQVAFLDLHPEVGVVGTDTLDMSATGEDIPTTHRRPTRHQDIVAALQDSAPLAHPSVMMRREVVRAVGGYRAAYHYCEDYDLWLRLCTQTELANLPERLLRYRRSDSQVSVRNALRQQTNATVAWLAHQERLAGRPDPTRDLSEMPPIESLDALFERMGVAREVRASLIPRIVYSPDAMRTEGFSVIAQHLREGGPKNRIWRTVIRMLSLGEPRLAARLTKLLITS